MISHVINYVINHVINHVIIRLINHRLSLQEMIIAFKMNLFFEMATKFLHFPTHQDTNQVELSLWLR